MSDRYSDIARDHFENPRNVGEIEGADVVGCAENPASGASLELYLCLTGGVIDRASFKAHGCTATIAAGSVATELLVGRKLAPNTLSRDDVEVALGGLPPTRKHAYRLVTDAVTHAARQIGVDQTKA